ncbi:MAG: helix-turn-helix domain-containing protein [Clostridiales bacterium]|jgi:transcriptional regulator with XRE-family HTH domain|nr:helix-turn-helix domain-containing protein [Eubacteriales bacterium]MDH7566685.1 helix-turn-helix domain-containing protein [Clostridiales bacterium]
MSDIAKIVGDRIRTIRNERGLSQEELAHRADIDPSHLIPV